jgi:hypothetical protein
MTFFHRLFAGLQQDARSAVDEPQENENGVPGDAHNDPSSSRSPENNSLK